MRLSSEPLPKNRRVVLGVSGILGVWLLGELLIRSGLLSGAGLPLPSSVTRQATALFADSTFLTEVWFTLREWMLGLMIATIVGVVLGGIMGAFTAGHAVFGLSVEILRPLPSIAVGPLLVLFLGSGMLPLALTVAVACVWPILFNTIYGVQSLDKVALEVAKTMNVSRTRIVTSIRLPSALPFVFTGVRVAASIGLIVAVSAELLIGNGRGIGGYILLKSTTATNLDQVYAATLVAGVLGVIVSGIFALVDRLAFGWKQGLSQ